MKQNSTYNKVNQTILLDDLNLYGLVRVVSQVSYLHSQPDFTPTTNPGDKEANDDQNTSVES